MENNIQDSLQPKAKLRVISIVLRGEGGESGDKVDSVSRCVTVCRIIFCYVRISSVWQSPRPGPEQSLRMECLIISSMFSTTKILTNPAFSSTPITISERPESDNTYIPYIVRLTLLAGGW